MGHLIAAPLIPLKSHQAAVDARAQQLFWALSLTNSQQTASNAQKCTNVPKHVPTVWAHCGTAEAAHDGGGGSTPATHLSPRVPAGTASRGWNTPPDARTLEKVQIRRCRCSSLSLQARPGWELCSGGPPHSPTPLYHQQTPPTGHRGRGLMAAIYDPQEPRIPPHRVHSSLISD